MLLVAGNRHERVGGAEVRVHAVTSHEEEVATSIMRIEVIAVIRVAVTDLAEILGMAIGIQLLTGLPLIWGVSITVLDTFLFLLLQRLGMRKIYEYAFRS